MNVAAMVIVLPVACVFLVDVPMVILATPVLVMEIAVLAICAAAVAVSFPTAGLGKCRSFNLSKTNRCFSEIGAARRHLRSFS